MKLIKQDSFNDCGSACITMIINHFNKTNILKEEIEIEQNLSNNCLSFFDLINISKEYGLSGEAYEAEVNLLLDNKNKFPIICQIVNEYGMLHFVVLDSIEREWLIVFDPSKDKVTKIKINAFKEIFQNKIIVFKKEKKFKKIGILNVINKNIGKYFYYAIAIATIDIIITAFLIFISSFIKYFQSWFLDYSNIKKDIFIFVLFSILLFIFKIIRKYVLNNISNIIFNQVLKEFSLFSKNISNEYFLKINFERKLEMIKTLDGLYIGIINLLSILISTLTSSLIILFLIYKISLSIISFDLINIFFVIIWITINKKIIYKLKMKHYFFNKVRNIKLSNFVKTNQNSDFDFSAKINLIDIEFINDGLFTINKIFYFLLMIFIFILVSNNKMNYPDLIYISILNSMLLSGINKMITGIWEVVNYRQAIYIKRLFSLKKNKSRNRSINKIDKIIFKKVSKQIDDSFIFEDLELNICNSSTLIVGSEGEFLKILNGQITNYTGKVLINEIDINELKNSSFNKISYIDFETRLSKYPTVIQNIVDGNLISGEIWNKLKDNGLFINDLIDLSKPIKSLTNKERQIMNVLSQFFIESDVIILNNSMNNVSFEIKEKIINLLIKFKKETLLICFENNTNLRDAFQDIIILNNI